MIRVPKGVGLRSDQGFDAVRPRYDEFHGDYEWKEMEKQTRDLYESSRKVDRPPSRAHLLWTLPKDFPEPVATEYEGSLPPTTVEVPIAVGQVGPPARPPPLGPLARPRLEVVEV